MSLVSSALRRLAGLTVVAGWSLAHAQQPVAPTGNAATSATNAPPPLRFSSQREFIPNAGPVARGQVHSRSNRLAFLYPPDTMARQDPTQRRMTFVARDDSYSLAVQLHDAEPVSVTNYTAEAWRTQLASRHADLQELEAFTGHALGTNGPALDFAWRTVGGHRLYSRAILLPVPGGRVEVLLLAEKDKFEAAKHSMNTLLLTLRRSGPEGEVVQPVVVPD